MKGRRIVPLTGLFAAGLLYSVLPHGAFGPYGRAVIVATVAALSSGVLLAWTRRRAAGVRYRTGRSGDDCLCLVVAMVESNNLEERLSRIEHIVEVLQRESAAAKVITAKLLLDVVVAAPLIAAVPPLKP